MFLMRDVLHWYDYKVHFDTDTISRNFENLQGSTLNRYVCTDTINRHRIESSVDDKSIIKYGPRENLFRQEFETKKA